MGSLKQVLEGASQQLVGDNARLDAEVLLCECLHKSRAYLYAWPEQELSEQQQCHFDALLLRRIAGEPIAHILGRREFWSLDLAVNNMTLIPRPETELLVEAALQRLPDTEQMVIDLGTGTGAIALALAKERPQWQLYASDMSWPAIQLSWYNQRRLGIANLQQFQGCWADAVKAGCFNLVVSNPPYIDSSDPHLRCGDLRFEPRSALVAAKDGFADIEAIVQQANQLLVHGGWLMLEHGFQQKQGVWNLMLADGFENISTLQDLAGLDRVTICQRN